MSKNTRGRKILFLACAALMLALLAAGGALAQDTGGKIAHAGQLELLQNASGMHPDAGLPLTGFSREGGRTLKSNTLTAQTSSSSTTACKAIAGKPLSFFSACYRRILTTAHICYLYESFGAPAGCRAPPAFSQL
jgi:hypothetical protein